MKVKELLQEIEANPDCLDYTVEIKISRPNAVGGTPTISVKGASFGFDWDTGKFIIYPERALKQLNKDDGTV